MTDAKPTAESFPLALPPEPGSPLDESADATLPPDCPPADAVLHIGAVYRLVKSVPPTDEDFKTYFVLYPGRKWKQQELCPAHGLSVRLTWEAAASQVARFRARIKAATWLVATATLNQATGR
jgi:hypothetical protein